MPEEGREQRKKEQKYEDAGETVQKIAVRQQVDDRIRVRVKEPVIITEKQFVKSGKKGIPVQDCAESGKKGQSGRNGRDDPKKNKPPFPYPEKSQKNVAALKIRRSWMASKIFLTSLKWIRPSSDMGREGK